MNYQCALSYFSNVNVLISNVKGCIERCSDAIPIELMTRTIYGVILSRPKNRRDGTHLIPPRQANLKLNYYIKMRKISYQLTLYPKTWLSRVQASKVL